MTVEPKLAADLDFSPEVVVVRYDEPRAIPPASWRWWPRALRRWGYRSVRRGFVLRPRTLRELITDQLAFEQVGKTYADDPVSYLTARVSLETASVHAVYLPADALKTIDATYRRVNNLVAVEDPDAPKPKAGDEPESVEVTFDAILRRMERAPFNLSRDAILDLTLRQIEARLSEWGQEKLNDLAIGALGG